MAALRLRTRWLVKSNVYLFTFATFLPCHECHLSPFMVRHTTVQSILQHCRLVVTLLLRPSHHHNSPSLKPWLGIGTYTWNLKNAEVVFNDFFSILQVTAPETEKFCKSCKRPVSAHRDYTILTPKTWHFNKQTPKLWWDRKSSTAKIGVTSYTSSVLD